MFIDINEMGRQERRVERALEVGDLRDSGGEPIPAFPARLRARARRGKRGVDLEGRVEAELTLPCARCAEPFLLPVSFEFYLTLVPAAVEFAVGDAEVRDEDATLFYASAEGKVDLRWVVSEQIDLHLPLKPVCRPGCRGLCAKCGQNLNDEACDCGRADVDPRLAPLLEFRGRGRE